MKKICIQCGEDKPLSRYTCDKGYYKHKCKDCYNQQRKLTRKPNRKPPPEPFVRPVNALPPPYVIPLAERLVYVPPRWGR